MSAVLNRRAVLRGAMGAGAVTVALPFLDCYLNSSGTALAATGAALPVVFGTWFQDLGFNPGRWVPKTVGLNFENNAELKVLDPFKSKMNLVSGLQYYLDGKPLETHATGVEIVTTGGIASAAEAMATADSLIADVIGTRTRFRSLEVALNGGRGSRSHRANAANNPSEPSPAALYTRIFGPEFKDPNAADFTPDPAVMARKSVLSYVTEQRKKTMGEIGAGDRARLDQYFTAIREIEQQLDLELQKPQPLPQCTVADKHDETKPSSLLTAAASNNKLFAELLAHAVACGQTRVINVNIGSQGLRKEGSAQTWHGWTHEEAVDEKTGVQPEVTSFIVGSTKMFAEFLGALDGYKEGAGTLLDRMGVMWMTDHGYARTHTMDNIPVMTFGSAGGRIKTGMHLSLVGDPATRVGLTMMQLMGVPVSTWGQQSNQTSKTITEIMA
jgi:hypothetical protein